MDEKFVYRLILEKYLIDDLIKIIIGYCEIYPRIQTFYEKFNDYQAIFEVFKFDPTKTYELKVNLDIIQDISIECGEQHWYLPYSKGHNSLIMKLNEDDFDEEDKLVVELMESRVEEIDRVHVTAIMLD